MGAEGPATGTNRAAREVATPSPWVIVASCIGYAMVIVDTTVINVALPALSHGLHTSISGLQWVVDGYTLVFAVLLLSAGAMGDRRGTKGTFLAGLVVFTVASVLCGLAVNVPTLVVARLIQGIGAALAVPASLALLQAAYTGNAARARAVGAWGATAGIAAGLGPALGGVLVNWAGWRSVFFINVPLGIAGLLLAVKYLPKPPRHSHGMDLPGQVTAVIALVSLAFGLIEAGDKGWGAAEVVTSFVIFAVGAAGFVVAERRVRQPMVPPELFTSRTMSTAMAVGFFVNLGFFGTLFVMGLYLQGVRGYPPLMAGLALTPQIATTVIGSMLSGRAVARMGPRPPMLIGLVVGATGLGSLAVAGAHSSYWTILPGLIAAGFGIAFAMMAATAAIMEHAPNHHGGIASGALNASRQVGGMVGVALLGTFVSSASDFVTGLHAAMGVSGGVFLLAAILTVTFVNTRTRDTAAVSTSHTSMAREGQATLQPDTDARP